MTKILTVKLDRSAEELIAKARKAAHENGIRFSGDVETGRFVGHGIEGSYRISGDSLSIHIARKPFIMPWAFIETTLRSYFA